MTDAIFASNATVNYQDAVGVSDLAFSLPKGTTLAVIGPNGSGKSTFLRAAAGLLAIASGSLDVAARNRTGGVALVLQTTDVDRVLPLTVHDTVRVARFAHLGLYRRPRAKDRKAIRRALERLDITDLEHRQIHDLSGGQRQRAFVAQGLAQEADLLLLDEPVTGLDVVSRQRILDVIEEERKAGRTVVASTHDLEDATHFDYVLLLATRQIAFGPPNEVLREGPLSQAFGGHILQVSDGALIMDDPHHHHDD